MGKQLKISRAVLEPVPGLVMNINEEAELWMMAARAVIVVIKGVENSDAGSPIFPWVRL